MSALGKEVAFRGETETNLSFPVIDALKLLRATDDSLQIELAPSRFFPSDTESYSSDIWFVSIKFVLLHFC